MLCGPGRCGAAPLRRRTARWARWAVWRVSVLGRRAPLGRPYLALFPRAAKGHRALSRCLSSGFTHAIALTPAAASVEQPPPFHFTVPEEAQGEPGTFAVSVMGQRLRAHWGQVTAGWRPGREPLETSQVLMASGKWKLIRHSLLFPQEMYSKLRRQGMHT